MDYQEFGKRIRKAYGKKEAKISGSYGVLDAFKWIRKNKWFDIKQKVTLEQFRKIVKGINEILKEELLEKGTDIYFPQRLGRLDLIKFDTKKEFINGKLKTNLRPNWGATLKLWYEDPESRENKVIIRYDQKEIYRLRYCHGKIKNLIFFQFIPPRSFRSKVHEEIRNKKLDAFKINKSYELYKHQSYHG